MIVIPNNLTNYEIKNIKDSFNFQNNFSVETTPTITERWDSRQRMLDYSESVASLGPNPNPNPRSRSGSEESSRSLSLSSSYSAPSTPVGTRRSVDSRYSMKSNNK